MTRRVSIVFPLIMFVFVTSSCFHQEVVQEKTQVPQSPQMSTQKPKISEAELMVLIEKDYKTLNELFDAYRDGLDGAYAEGYAAKLYNSYVENGSAKFVQVLAAYPKTEIDNITRLLTGELYFSNKKSLYKHELKLMTRNPNIKMEDQYVLQKILDYYSFLEKSNL